ncbi:unnamed protein product [Rhizophagus irregularis]|nr:unnamed protein product [Rhizophagus irregularis]
MLKNNSTPEKTLHEFHPHHPHLHSNHKLKKNKSKEQEPAVEKSEKEISKPPTHKPVQISNDSTVGDDESIWDEGDQPTTSYNIARKLSNIEEDVCYPLRTTNKGDGIDYNALEEYTTEEKTSAKKDEGNYHLLPQVITQGAKPSVNFCWTLSSVMQIRSSDSYEFVPDAPLPTYEQIIENGWLV